MSAATTLHPPRKPLKPLDEALAEAQARSAKNEALQRAYASSGKSVDAFADMYGLDPQAVARLLAR